MSNYPAACSERTTSQDSKQPCQPKLPPLAGPIPMLAPERAFATQGPLWLAACERVLASGRYILGEHVEAFEQAMATYLGSEHAIGVSSGSDALLLALQALGIGPGDEVLLPSFTFFATAGSVARLGATPIFVDLAKDSFAMCPQDGASKYTSRTKAVLVVHLFGLASPMAAWWQFCQRHGLALIEDCAQALGATYREQSAYVGTLADVGCYSFFPSKQLGGFGDGGLVVTKQAELAQRLRILRIHGASKPYDHQAIGGNFRLDAMQAALLHCKLPMLAQQLARRRQHAAFYHQQAQAMLPAGEQALKLPPLHTQHTFNQFVLRVKSPSMNANTGSGRDLLQQAYRRQGIASAIYYPLGLHQQPCFAHLPRQVLPHTEQMCREVLAIPIFPELLEHERQRICAVWQQAPWQPVAANQPVPRATPAASPP